MLLQLLEKVLELDLHNIKYLFFCLYVEVVFDLVILPLQFWEYISIAVPVVYSLLFNVCVFPIGLFSGRVLE